MEENIKAVCFGEILWDVFPDEERIGGAPLNVASRMSSFGIKTEMISKVGNDKKGENLISYLKSSNIEVKNIHKDDDLPTGVVNVSLSSGGSATYEIAYPVAWDNISFSEEMKRSVKKADVFIFGSLVCRDNVSRSTLFKLLQEAKLKVLDINLRPPHYKKEVLLKLIQQANIIKFNDEELYEIAAIMGSPFHSLEQNLGFIAKQTSATSICVTKGQHGAVLLTEDKFYYNSGFKIKVKDTVGSGDSFLATLIAKLLADVSPQKALNYACAVGALVAGKEGANPELSSANIEVFLSPMEKR